MNFRAFLEYTNNNLPLDDFVYISQFPLQERGYNIKPCIRTRNQYTQLQLATKNDIAVGSVEFCNDFFKAINVEVPKYIGYPDSIKEFLGREIFETSLEEVESKNLFPVFVKPKDKVKLFTGTVLDSAKDIMYLKLGNVSLNNNDIILASEIIDIHSEYRVFVHSKPDGFLIKDKIVGIKHYNGDYKIFPNDNTIQGVYEIIESYTDCPVSYSIDIGIAKYKDKKNKDFIAIYLIEINDFWALGSYGLDGKLYTKLYVDRMKEIIFGK